MYSEIASAWSVLLLRGICNVLFALVAFLQPGLTLVALVLLWGIYAVVDGSMSLTTGIAARRSGGHSSSLVLAGAAGSVAGVTACVWPGVTMAFLLTIVSAWAIVRGALEFSAAIRLRSILPRAWLLAASGTASIVLGVLLVGRSEIGLITLAHLAGGATLTVGTLAIALALHLRRLLPEHRAHLPRLPA